MSENLDALAALKTAFQSVDPTPQDAPVAVYDAMVDDITMGDLPIVIVDHAFGGRHAWQPVSQGQGRHVWAAEINVILEYGVVSPFDYSAMQTAKNKAYGGWIEAIATTLFANRGLGGEVLATGDSTGLFTYRVGHIGRYKILLTRRTTFGIIVQLPIVQLHSLPSS